MDAEQLNSSSSKGSSGEGGSGGGGAVSASKTREVKMADGMVLKTTANTYGALAIFSQKSLPVCETPYNTESRTPSAYLAPYRTP